VETLRAIIKGKVQGVWFRDFAQKEATKLGLSGWVTNRDDGSVYIETCGTMTQLKSFEKWLQIGSPLSRVSKVNSEWGIAIESTESFEIKY